MSRSAQRMVFGNGISNIDFGRISLSKVRVAWPRSCFTAHKYAPFLVSLTLSWSILTPAFSANFLAAMVGLPDSSSPTLTGGPVNSVFSGSCLAATFSTRTASRRGDPNTSAEPCSIRASVIFFCSVAASAFSAGSM